MVDLTVGALRAAGIEVSDAKVAVLGYAYLENSDDTRNSPSEVLVHGLRRRGAEITIHDPWVPEYQGQLIERVLDCDAAVVMVKHQEYYSLDLTELRTAMRTPILIDGRHVFDQDRAKDAGLVYHGLGQGR
jgi:UDP-N-acetyl-D-mannosaminuronic acid dehydrogenase